jgi:DNA-binding transcriptional LysR family regulator
VEFRHLRYFIAVAEELNITRAAEKLNVSQPPLSRQIRQLEEEVGVALFDRDTKGVVLTPAGEIFLRESRQLLVHLERVLEAVRPPKEARFGTVNVGLAAGLSASLASILAAYEKQFPLVTIQCKDILSGYQSQALTNKAIDIGFLRPPVEPVHLMSEFIFQESIMVVLPRHHVLAKNELLRLREIANETLLLQARNFGSGIHEKFLQMFRNIAVEPKIVQTQTGAHEEAGSMLVASGKGVFLIPSGLAHRCINDEITAIRIAEPNAFFEVHMAWRRNETSPLVNDLLRFVREHYSHDSESPLHTLRA